MKQRKPFASLIIPHADDSSMGVIRLSGYITDENNAAFVVRQAIDQACRDYPRVRIDFINCYGGSVYEGFPTAQLINSHPKIEGTLCNGVIASMATVMFAGGKKREVVKYSRAMMHKPKIGAHGESSDLREQATNLEVIENDMAQFLATAMGKTIEVVKAKYMRAGKDTWMNYQEMLSSGLATSVVEGDIIEEAPTNVLLHSEVDAIASFYESQLDKYYSNDTQNMKKELICAALGLPLDTPDDKVMAAIASVVATVASLKQEAETAKASAETVKATAAKDKAEMLVTAAFEANKITAKEKDSMLKLAISDYDSVKAILDERKPHTPITAQLNGGPTAGIAAAYACKEGETDKDCYMRLWKDNKLEACLKNDPERYKVLKAAAAK